MISAILFAEPIDLVPALALTGCGAVALASACRDIALAGMMEKIAELSLAVFGAVCLSGLLLAGAWAAWAEVRRRQL